MNRLDPWPHRAAPAMLPALVATAILSVTSAPAFAAAGGEASLVVPDLGTVAFGGMSGRAMLEWGLVV